MSDTSTTVKANFWEKMKTRWGISSDWQAIIICVVFAITGMSAVEIRKVIFPLVGVTAETSGWLKTTYWLLLVFPSYYVFLLFYGFIFGQFNFFWKMFKKTFGRIPKMFRKKEISKG